MESPLFNAMTSPPQFMGIDADFFLMIFVGGLLILGATNSIIYCVCLVPIYLLGYYEGKKDKYFFKVILKKIECGFTRNYQFWGCHAYEAY